MPRSVTKICKTPSAAVSGDAKAAEPVEGAGATLICTITVPVALVRGQDVLLTVTPLPLPFQKPE
jgi:hypothetical protein